MNLLAPLSNGAAAREVEAQLTSGGRDRSGTIFKRLLQLTLLISVMTLVILLASQLQKGAPVLTTRLGSFLTSGLRSDPAEAGIWDGIVGSFWIAVITILLAFPIGIAAGIYLEEYATRNWFTRTVDVAIRNLAGVPSIVYGVLGYAIFVELLKPITGPDIRGANGSLLAGGLTIAVLVLPIVIITSAEAIRAVPDSIREAGFGVGATRWEVVKAHVLPYAAPGILTGTVLALARAVGEAAPLILVGAVRGRLGRTHDLLDLQQLRDRFTAMPNVIADWATRPEQGFQENTAAAIVVLLVFVLLANLVAILLRNHFDKKRNSPGAGGRTRRRQVDPKLATTVVAPLVDAALDGPFDGGKTNGAD